MGFKDELKYIGRMAAVIFPITYVSLSAGFQTPNPSRWQEIMEQIQINHLYNRAAECFGISVGTSQHNILSRLTPDKDIVTREELEQIVRTCESRRK